MTDRVSLLRRLPRTAPGLSAPASAGSGAIRTRRSPRPRAASHLLVAEPEPDVAHLLPVLLAIVRQHVADQQPPAGLQHARGFAQRGRRVRHVVQHEQQRGGVELAVVDRQRLELAAPDVDVRADRAAAAAPPAASRPTDRRRSRSPRTAPARAATWPVPHPRSPTTHAFVEQRGQRLQMRRCAEQVLRAA